MGKKRVYAGICGLVLMTVCLCSPCATAWTCTFDLEFKDAEGNPIAGVHVVLKNERTGSTLEGYTGIEGTISFDLNDLQGGWTMGDHIFIHAIKAGTINRVEKHRAFEGTHGGICVMVPLQPPKFHRTINDAGDLDDDDIGWDAYTVYPSTDGDWHLESDMRFEDKRTTENSGSIKMSRHATSTSPEGWSFPSSEAEASWMDNYDSFPYDSTWVDVDIIVDREDEWYCDHVFDWGQPLVTVEGYSLTPEYETVAIINR